MHTLASGSSGNCVLLSHEDTHILVDAGVSCRKIQTRLQQLGLTPGELSALLVTHTHSDHVCGLAVLTKRHPIPVYATPQAGEVLAEKLPALAVSGLLRTVSPDQPFAIGGFQVTAFSTPHDAPGSVGYLFAAGGRRAAVVTDLGYLAPTVSEALQDVDLALVEANHDVDWLRTGPYPYYLQERVLGKYGHLSNEACGEVSVQLARTGASTLVLAHLSQENNTPQRAYDTVARMLQGAGCTGVRLFVAPRDELSPAYTV